MPPSDLTDCHTGLGRLLDDPRLFLIAPAPPALRPQHCDLHRPDDLKASLKVRTPPQPPLSQKGAYRMRTIRSGIRASHGSVDRSQRPILPFRRPCDLKAGVLAPADDTPTSRPPPSLSRKGLLLGSTPA